MRKIVLIGLIIILISAVFFTGFFVKKDFAPKLIFGNLYRENLLLKQQNEDLKAQLQRCQVSGAGCQVSSNDYLTAKIFSTYPFNLKNQLTVDAGEKQGVKKSATAAVGENILLGRVIEVFENFSVIRTIFDQNWQLPVRIGEKEINGLLQGGNKPKIILIEKPISAGDAVYSAGLEFPYGLKIGEISEIKESASGIFKEAGIKTPYNISELREANILIVN